VTNFRLGFQFSSVTYPDLPIGELFGRIVQVTQAAEQSGFDSVWVPDHALQNPVGGGPTAPMLEAYSLLAALAVPTERVMLGALVSPVTFRLPSLLAKTIATLDVISGGRAVLGLGAAWDVDEHAAYGVDFPGLGERQDRLEETVQICQAMLSGEPATFSGRYYSVTEAINSPRPLQPKVPLMVAGGGERRTLRTVARYADACNIFGDADALGHKLDVLRAHCDDAGRDMSEIVTTTAVFPPATVDELQTAVGAALEAGIDGVILMATDTPDADTVASWGQALSPLFA
jgi:F420-dependent oxidoreductase-like protein